MVHTSDCVKVAFQRLCTKANTPYALSAIILLRESDEAFIKQLMMPQPSRYLDASAFRVDYLIYNYMRKYVGLETGINTKEVALSKWKTAEERCSQTNHLLKSGSYLGYDVETAILRARHRIARVLGKFSYSKVLSDNGMGPGATFDMSRRARPGIKYSLPISVTGSALALAKAWLEHDIHWFSNGTGVVPDGPYSVLDNNFLVVAGNKMTTVLKDSSTDRVICIEPTFNLFLQKGAGSFIRRQLKKFGVDLDDQSRNQDLARLAYDLGLATLDLSSASDTICEALVKLLLPLDWWLYLDLIRSHSTRLSKDKWHKNAKFSSMGNGFTFELESLIFWALSPESCTELAVYGDDIICDQSSSAEYITILTGVGFTINEAKSFVDGCFFESCGKHFFMGEDVSPCFQKEIVETASAFVRAHNRLLKLNTRDNGAVMTHNLYTHAANVFFSSYPYERKPFVPHTADDRGFHTYRFDSFPYCPNRGYQFPVLKVPKLKLRIYQDGLYVRKLLQPYAMVFDPKGLILFSDTEAKAKLSKAWIHPEPIRSTWLPRPESCASTSTTFECIL